MAMTATKRNKIRVNKNPIALCIARAISQPPSYVLHIHIRIYIPSTRQLLPFPVNGSGYAAAYTHNTSYTGRYTVSTVYYPGGELRLARKRR